MAETVGVNDKKWWGPRIWRILHSLAEISDRVDCGPAWRVALSTTAEMLPCAVCRAHFHGHVRQIPLPVGKIPRDGLRRRLWAAHASTGGVLPEDSLTAEYGCGGDRAEVLRVTGALTEEVFAEFQHAAIYDRFTSGRLVTWRRAIQTLIALLQTPLTAVVSSSGGRGGRSSHSLRHAGDRRRM